MRDILNFWTELSLWKKVTIGLVLGIITGLVFGEKAANLKIIGEIFMRLIQMVIVPLIYISIVTAIINVEDTSKLSRITIKAFVLFILTTCVAVAVGLILTSLFNPGGSIDPQMLSLKALGESAAEVNVLSPSKVMKDIIPENALNALVSGNLLQVIFFSFFTGFVINLLSAERKTMVKVFSLGFKIVFKMIEMILKLAPYGAFGFAAAIVGEQGVNVLQSLGALMLVFLLVIVVQYLVFGVFILFSGLSPLPFYKKSIAYQALAFSTSSSKATLPTTMRVCSEKMGISKTNTSFVLPLGAAINMNGTSIYLGVCALFFAQIYNIDLTLMDYILIIFTSTLGSIGAAGVPCGSIIMLPMVLSSINVPIEGIALIVGIDRVLDMFRTTLNITGDAAVTLMVDRSEGTLDEKIYYSAKGRKKLKS